MADSSNSAIRELLDTIGFWQNATILDKKDVADNAVLELVRLRRGDGLGLRPIYHEKPKSFGDIYVAMALSYNYRLTGAIPNLGLDDAYAVVHSFEQIQDGVEFFGPNNLNNSAMKISFVRAFMLMSDEDNSRLRRRMAASYPAISMSAQHLAIRKIREFFEGSMIEPVVYLNEAVPVPPSSSPPPVPSESALDLERSAHAPDPEADLVALISQPLYAEVATTPALATTIEVEPAELVGADDEPTEEILGSSEIQLLPRAIGIELFDYTEQLSVSIFDLPFLAVHSMACFDVQMLDDGQRAHVFSMLKGIYRPMLRHVVCSERSRDFYVRIYDDLGLPYSMHTRSNSFNDVAGPHEDEALERGTSSLTIIPSSDASGEHQLLTTVVLVYSCLRTLKPELERTDIRRLLSLATLDLRATQWLLCPTPWFYKALFDLDGAVERVANDYRREIIPYNFKRQFDIMAALFWARAFETREYESVRVFRHTIEDLLTHTDNNASEVLAVGPEQMDMTQFLPQLDSSTKYWLAIHANRLVSECYDAIKQTEGSSHQQLSERLQGRAITLEHLAFAAYFVLALDMEQISSVFSIETDDYRFEQIRRGCHITMDNLVTSDDQHVRGTRRRPVIGPTKQYAIAQALSHPPLVNSLRHSLAPIEDYLMLTHTRMSISFLGAIDELWAMHGERYRSIGLESKHELQVVLHKVLAWLRAMWPLLQITKDYAPVSHHASEPPTHQLWSSVMAPIIRHYLENHASPTSSALPYVDLHLFDQTSYQYVVANNIGSQTREALARMFQSLLTHEYESRENFERGYLTHKSVFMVLVESLALLCEENLRSLHYTVVPATLVHTHEASPIASELTTIVLVSTVLAQARKHELYSRSPTVERVYDSLKKRGPMLISEWRSHRLVVPQHHHMREESKAEHDPFGVLRQTHVFHQHQQGQARLQDRAWSDHYAAKHHRGKRRPRRVVPGNWIWNEKRARYDVGQIRDMPDVWSEYPTLDTIEAERPMIKWKVEDSYYYDIPRTPPAEDEELEFLLHRVLIHHIFCGKNLDPTQEHVLPYIYRLNTAFEVLDEYVVFVLPDHTFTEMRENESDIQMREGDTYPLPMWLGLHFVTRKVRRGTKTHLVTYDGEHEVSLAALYQQGCIRDSPSFDEILTNNAIVPVFKPLCLGYVS